MSSLIECGVPNKRNILPSFRWTMSLQHFLWSLQFYWKNIHTKNPSSFSNSGNVVISVFCFYLQKQIDRQNLKWEIDYGIKKHFFLIGKYNDYDVKQDLNWKALNNCVDIIKKGWTKVCSRKTPYASSEFDSILFKILFSLICSEKN